ncbi:unnamed protein product [Amoebophrya sp. A120]|nr:unnamed protein product [Amoebophrya sp. A120]|eukprot:GSA120T00013257001.1
MQDRSGRMRILLGEAKGGAPTSVLFCRPSSRRPARSSADKSASALAAASTFGKRARRPSCGGPRKLPRGNTFAVAARAGARCCAMACEFPGMFLRAAEVGARGCSVPRRRRRRAAGWEIRPRPSVPPHPGPFSPTPAEGRAASAFFIFTGSAVIIAPGFAARYPGARTWTGRRPRAPG